ncbi:Cytidylate kinase [hydrothermal vent metagenome]|uniref:(d)CMP kinase n=1 Tax=hydrothermal vent metagenome TaxID=652676 RepID=A0A3B1CDT8_9ZZZZ
MIIAIDGPAGSGKSSVAKIIAQKLQFRHVNTGAMYRAVALKARQLNRDLGDEGQVAEVARKQNIEFIPGASGQAIVLDGEDVTSLLRSEQVDQDAAIVASLGEVREILVAKQRDMEKTGSIVMEGRDIGTVVFPQAERKFFLDATPEERGKRRFQELQAKHQEVDVDTIIEQIRQRDEKDRNREVSPLIQAKDAIYIDTTNFKLEEVVEQILESIEQLHTKIINRK